MSGLEKIAAEIKRGAQAKADEILAQAKEKARGIEEAAVKERSKLEERGAEDAARASERVAAQFASENRQRRKQALLKARSAAVEEIIAEAGRRIGALDGAAYFDLMRHICVTNAQAGEGRLYFAKKDFDRLPGDFADKCNAQISGGSVTLAGSTDVISDGFRIVYGKIEQNCSLGSIFESRKNELWDAVTACLVEE